MIWAQVKGCAREIVQQIILKKITDYVHVINKFAICITLLFNQNDFISAHNTVPFTANKMLNHLQKACDEVTIEDRRIFAVKIKKIKVQIGCGMSILTTYRRHN